MAIAIYIKEVVPQEIFNIQSFLVV